jgi:hypothetical protein
MNSNGTAPLALDDGQAQEYNPAWQPLPEGTSPPEDDFKNDSKRCKAQPGDHRNHGQCVKAGK